MAQEFYRLRVQGLHQTEYNECVMYFRGDNLTANDYIVNAADLVSTWISEALPAWLDMFPTSYQVLRVSAARESAAGGGEITTQFAMGAMPGTVSGGAASQQLCPVIRLIPPTGIPSAGKIFLPCIAESGVNGNIPQAAWISQVAAYMGIVLQPFATSAISWQEAIFSRKNQSFSLALTYDTSPIIGFQRRRQRAFL